MGGCEVHEQIRELVKQPVQKNIGFDFQIYGWKGDDMRELEKKRGKKAVITDEQYFTGDYLVTDTTNENSLLSTFGRELMRKATKSEPVNITRVHSFLHNRYMVSRKTVLQFTLPTSRFGRNRFVDILCLCDNHENA